MTAAAHPYELLAELLDYPGPDLCATAERCRAALAGRCPEAEAAVEGFLARAAGARPHEMEELYVRAFDLRPEASLDLGYQIFGESYKRGIFLVKMQRAARAHGVDLVSELPDHLPVVLRLVARLDEAEDPRSLVDEIVLPAVAKVVGMFDTLAKEAKEAQETREMSPYVSLLRAALALLQRDFAIPTIRELPRPIELPYDGGRDEKRRLEVLTA